MYDMGSASLYKAWFERLPQMFRAMMPAGASDMFAMPGNGQPSATPPPPFPAGPIAQAVQMTSAMLGQLYQAYLPMLAQGGLSTDAIQTLARGASETYQRLQQALGWTNEGFPDAGSFPSLHGATQSWQALLGPLAGAHSSEGRKLLQLGVERTFGGLSEAFGLGPMRELDEAMREMASANIERQRAQLEYLALWVEAWNEGTQALLRELTAKATRGERVDSMLALLRLWAKSVDGAAHRMMQSKRGLSATAKAIRATTVQREHVQKVVHIASEAMHLPTRAEVDEAYREIQELKRELRQLRKSLASQPAKASAAVDAAVGPPARKRSRAAKPRQTGKETRP
jgi:hypothetical protein